MDISATSFRAQERQAVGLRRALGVGVAAWAGRATAQPKATTPTEQALPATDGKVMDELTSISLSARDRPPHSIAASAALGRPLRQAPRSRWHRGEMPGPGRSTPWRVPHFARRTACSRHRRLPASAKGFRGDGYLPANRVGGTFQARYSLPLDVPAAHHVPQREVMKDAGWPAATSGARGRARDERVTMQRITKADTFASRSAPRTRGATPGASNNLLWPETAPHLAGAISARGRPRAPALAVADFWEAFPTTQGRPGRQHQLRDPRLHRGPPRPVERGLLELQRPARPRWTS